ncbi:MAG: peroxide stress protein YaaA [Oxalobacteraceae bacterium]|nr:peroxide stress protein YaaA [Oxalobacteraceae bacterium]
MSPAKTLDFDTPPTTSVSSQCDFLNQSAELIKILKPMGLGQVAALMDLSDKLAALNVARFGAWKRPFTSANAKQAVLAFDGDVYDGLSAKTMNKTQLGRAQKCLRILSGLYGLLRPLDLDLYSFWGDRIGKALNTELQGHREKVLINLASDEYFKSVQALSFPVVTPVFQEKKSGAYKVVSFNAKRARGLMARFVIDEAIDRPEGLKDFALEDYRFDAKASTESKLMFRRG